MSERKAYDDVRRFGVILPSVNTVLESELYGLGVDDATFHFVRVRGERGSDETILRRMADEAPEVARILRDARPEMIVFACTSGSLVGGPGFDEEVAASITTATGIPATTTATEVLSALRALRARVIGVGTPYLDWVTESEVRFFEAAGFRVAATASLGLDDGHAMAALTERQGGDLARSVNHPEADAIFLSCTDLPTLGSIAKLEAELGKPVVSSNLATIRGMLGDDRRLGGLGTLFAGARQPT